tara:strand:+ start:548 stop:1114 length:567 start_codon:yes stop_codon:yes gene_type:complete
MATYESRRYNTPVPDASKIADGSVDNTEFQHLDGVTSDIQTQLTSKLPLAGGTLTGNLSLGDNDEVRIGDGSDLTLAHDGTNSTIQNDTGVLKVSADTVQFKNHADNATLATFTNGGAVNLRFNGSSKVDTTNTGASITGALVATGTVTGVDSNSVSAGLSAQSYKATVSTSDPSGGNNGDVWYKYTV